MAVKIRLSKRGRKKLALYDIVVASQSAPRDGRFIEKVGNYNPNTSPATINLATDKIVQWLFNGAQPTDTVKSILSSQGILLKKHLQIGVKKGAITQEEADKKFLAWQQAKAQKPAKFKPINQASEKESVGTEVAPTSKTQASIKASKNQAPKESFKKVASNAPATKVDTVQQAQENVNPKTEVDTVQQAEENASPTIGLDAVQQAEENASPTIGLDAVQQAQESVSPETEA